MNDHDLLRYSRHLLLDEIGLEGQMRLQQSRVLVIGCGGLGSAALPYLAAAGIGHLQIADDDAVELSNLQRQIAYTAADIGQNKAAAMQRFLQGINPQVRVTVHPERAGPDALAVWAEQADVLLDCSDNFITRHALNRASVAAAKPLVSGAAVRFSGQLCVYDPRLADSPCYACLYEHETGSDGSCALFGVFAPLVGIIGSAQAAAALRLLLGLPQPVGVLQQYHGLDGGWQSFRLPRNPDCPVCGRQEPTCAQHRVTPHHG